MEPTPRFDLTRQSLQLLDSNDHTFAFNRKESIFHANLTMNRSLISQKQNQSFSRFQSTVESVFNQLRVPEDDPEEEDQPSISRNHQTSEATNRFKRQRRQLINYVTDLESELVSQVKENKRLKS